MEDAGLQTMAMNKWKFTKTTGNPRNPGRRQGGKLLLFPAEQETFDATVLPEFMRSTCLGAAHRTKLQLVSQKMQLSLMVIMK
jgi:hypothetical protein